MKTWILTLWLIILSWNIHAQINRVTIQASGLTCSLCSNAINKALKTLDFVAEVEPNIEQSTFDISFKNSSAVNFDLLKKKVEGAGFFVAKMWVEMNIAETIVENDAHIEVHGMMMHFLNVGNKTLNGKIILRILDKGFVSSKEYKKNARFTRLDCYKTGMMGPCCKNRKGEEATRIYHVTI
jgi:copper chaperone CopZ